MMKLMSRQRGAILVLVFFVIIILIGVSAFALDLGRAYVQRTEMQNAADAAALAAAAELDSGSGAIERAKLAARDLLTRKFSHFATDNSLEELAFEFYCSIGASVEGEISDHSVYCPGASVSPDDANLWVVDESSTYADTSAHYVRVHMEPREIKTFFLPVLNVLGGQALDVIEVSAEALAGRHFYLCKLPPILMCNPGEPSGVYDPEDFMPIGQQMVVKGSSTWTPGNFGFLDPPSGTTNEALADEGELGCAPPDIETNPGNMPQKTAEALSTRFGVYRSGSAFNDPVRYKPAINVANYGRDPLAVLDAPYGAYRFDLRDENLRVDYSPSEPPAVKPIFGNTNWKGVGNTDVNNYWCWAHEGQAAPCPDMPNFDAIDTRYELYQLEMNWDEESSLASRSYADFPAGMTADQISEAETVYDSFIKHKIPALALEHEPYFDGKPFHDDGGFSRRILYVAVVNCLARGFTGKSQLSVYPPERFAKLFITQRTISDSEHFSELHEEKGDIWVELAGWAQEHDVDYHVEIQLYD